MVPFKIFVLGLLALADITFGYKIGVGRADVTGPIVDVTLMGYGKFGQKGRGIHTRQWSRAYIIADDKSRMVFVNVDIGMMGDGVRIQVIKNLEKKFQNVYNHDNVIISGTHTHSGVGGYLMHTFFDIPSAGFCKETFYALVTGIVKSIEKAHNSLQDGKIFLATETVLGITVSRSPTSYLENPKEERAQYKYDIDKEMFQLRFVSNKNDTPIGAINWYPIHGTTLNNTNYLVSSDNIGYGSIFLEQKMSPSQLAGKSDFVGSFASTNLGDVSPNIKGPKCHQSGTECTIYSRCENIFEECFALGPGSDMFESAEIIGLKLFEAAWKMIQEKKGVEITGPVQSIHQYVDMSKAKAVIYNKAKGTTEEVRGCVPAMGYSAGAGTTDGQFLPFLHQGQKNSSWLVDAIRNAVARPSKEDIECHAPKPILLATGLATFPFDWAPRIVSTQLARIGNVAIACVPGEFTTMSGRRMKKAVAEVLGADTTVIIAGLCNTYSDYIATFEEYQAQRYEAGSTLFGPHTLSLHLEQYKKLAKALKDNTSVGRGPEPQGLDPEKMISFIPPVVFDAPKANHKFGDVLLQPLNSTIEKYGDIIKATFVSGNPRNNLRLDDTFFLIETDTGSGNYIPFENDASLDTKMHWRRTNPELGTSEVDIEWKPRVFQNGQTFRIRHFGEYKTEKGEIKSYTGTTQPFTLIRGTRIEKQMAERENRFGIPM